ncbi:ABC transporter substrate-binding protein [Streptomyces sp. M2CJ-2]|uniref:ABC transporter substrate-binding protein n=1 Tax=Streptomyces sp. M2CJ-2 TaxID=2803948 RepID=UPI0019264280|nr:ABC transporter substrate-binding protein [Streptomyces sp. M2CJ-2]MBL3668043.1 ABC transporter substrate-binding protein [Streptomyces sp. M2CJ-2]
MPSRTRTALAALAVGALLATAGCGRGESKGSNDTAAAAPGFDGRTLTLGVLNVTSGPAASSFAPIGAGAKAYVDALNARGGIAGKYPVELITRDTAYDPSKTAQAYEATKREVAAYALVTGTLSTDAVLPQARKDDVLVFSASADGKFFHQSHVLSIAMPAQSQFLNGAEYLTRGDGKGRKLCSLATEGPRFETATAVVEYAGKKMGMRTGPSLAVQSGVKPTTQIQQLKKADCDMVMMSTAQIPEAPDVLTAAIEQDFEPTWIANAGSWGPFLNDGPLYDYTTEHMVIITEGLPWGADDAGMRQLLADQKKYAPDARPSVGFLWGYNQLAAVEAVLTEAAEQDDLSRAGIMRAQASLSSLDLATYYPRPWGAAADRGQHTQYCVLVPSKSGKDGTEETACHQKVTQDVLDYPYPAGD